MLKQFLLLGFLAFTVVFVSLSTPIYAMSLDDDEEDAEDVADLLEKAKSAGKSESFGEADALLKKAKMYGVSTDDTQEASSYVAKKKQARDERLERERKEKERLARLKREKEERERQARLARQRVQQSAQSRSRYISSLGYCTSSLTHDSIWSRGCIKLNNGSTIWANLLRKSGGCWSLLVGSSETNIYGNCSNCSNDMNGYWSCNASGYGSFSYQGDPSNAVNSIVQRSN